jgi:hypothetical protein
MRSARTQQAPPPEPSTAAAPAPTTADEESLEAESERTGIPVTILRRMSEARKKADP